MIETSSFEDSLYDCVAIFTREGLHRSSGGFNKDYKQFMVSKKGVERKTLNIEILILNLKDWVNKALSNPSDHAIIGHRNQKSLNHFKGIAKILGINFYTVKPGDLTSKDLFIPEKNLLITRDKSPFLRELLGAPYYSLTCFYTGKTLIRGFEVIPIGNYGEEEFRVVKNFIKAMVENGGEVPPGFDPGSSVPKTKGISSTSRD